MKHITPLTAPARAQVIRDILFATPFLTALGLAARVFGAISLEKPPPG